MCIFGGFEMHFLNERAQNKKAISFYMCYYLHYLRSIFWMWETRGQDLAPQRLGTCALAAHLR